MAHGQRPQTPSLNAGLRRPIILATASPRRHALFRAFGIPHRIQVPRVREAHHEQGHPRRLVRHNALLKARAVASRRRKGLVVAADTVVVCNGTVFGKPRDRGEALRMLRALSGKTHQVYTAVCVVDVDRRKTLLDVATTRVRLRRLSAHDIAQYVTRTHPWDKSVAYAVQDPEGMMIDRLHGSLSNVVGLPLDLVERQLRACGVRLR